jgi:DHA1 family multidrug resistance protein-like MFS transporter
MLGWRRTFAAVWSANTITSIGMMAFLPFFPTHLEALGLTDRDEIALWSGALFGAAPLSAALCSPLWGVIGDRVGRRVMVLRSILAITVFVGAMAFARDPWQLLALRIAQGVFSGFVAPSMTLVSVLAPPGAQGRVQSWLNTSLVLGTIVGPVVGDRLWRASGVQGVYFSVAAASAVSALLVGLFAEEDPALRKPPGARSGWAGALRGAFGDVGELRGHRALRASIAVTFWIQFGLGATNPLLDLHVRDLESPWFGPRPQTGPLFTAMALASLVAMPLWGRYGDRHGTYAALLRCAVACGAALALQALATSYEALLAGRVLFGAAIAGSAPLAFGVAAADSTPQQRGGAMGLIFSARALAVAVGSIAGGWLSSWLGVRGLFVASALVLFACLAWLRRSRRAAPDLSPASPQSVGGRGTGHPQG